MKIPLNSAVFLGTRLTVKNIISGSGFHLLSVEILKCEFAYAKAPEKKFKADEAAKQFNAEILRLLVRNCILNPIVLAWTGLKTYIRDNNTSFKLTDVNDSALQWIAPCDSKAATDIIKHT
ncbi:unnamed protein product [Rotaria sordida]|uniref:Uncharacterized protein n=2 Tax=Rotaria sordida TaxID=392033 RepID=A0A815XMM2_9BILA|nr:unnamed protein product [Rotaria sordida]CAF1280689.1 unnamed protein product [Rotaria sordida]CAF1559330.1 unnamed protein product [Rotaria sordida]CAF1559451.1 unnamed protein product [Rotaria sordida]